MVSDQIRRAYLRERRSGFGSMMVGHAAEHALAAARTRIKWEALENAEFVCIEVLDDHDFCPGEGNCCCNDPRCSAKTGPAYGLVARYRVTHDDRWEVGDAVWGLTGYDAVRDNPYTVDIMAETIRTLVAARKRRLANPLGV